MWVRISQCVKKWRNAVAWVVNVGGCVGGEEMPQPTGKLGRRGPPLVVMIIIL